jgi:hypothetical protein
LSLCFYLNWAPRQVGVLGKWRYSSTHFLTSALDGSERSASRPGRFTARERAAVTHWIGGWVGPRAGLDTVVKRKIPSPAMNRTLEPNNNNNNNNNNNLRSPAEIDHLSSHDSTL